MSDHLLGEATALVICYHVGDDLPANAEIEGVVLNHANNRTPTPSVPLGVRHGRVGAPQ
jgi:hypothetical protein